MTLRIHAATRRARREDGQAYVEFALVLPILLLVVMGIIQFGTAFKDYIALTDAVRVGARQASVSRSIVDPNQRVPLIVAEDEGRGRHARHEQDGHHRDPVRPVTNTATWAASGDVTVRASYPFKVNLLRHRRLQQHDEQPDDRTGGVDPHTCTLRGGTPREETSRRRRPARPHASRAALARRRERRAVDRHRRASSRAASRRRPGRRSSSTGSRSTAGHYTAFNLGVQTTTKQARYGTFTIYLVSGSDVAADVKRLLTDPHTGELGTPATGGHLLGEGRDDERHGDLDGEAPVRRERRHLVDDHEAGAEDRQHVDDPPQGAHVGDEERLS